jgi:hypothetical protein
VAYLLRQGADRASTWSPPAGFGTVRLDGTVSLTAPRTTESEPNDASADAAAPRGCAKACTITGAGIVGTTDDRRDLMLVHLDSGQQVRASVQGVLGAATPNVTVHRLRPHLWAVVIDAQTALAAYTLTVRIKRGARPGTMPPWPRTRRSAASRAGRGSPGA